MSAVKAIFNLMNHYSNQYKRLEIKGYLSISFSDIEAAVLSGKDDLKVAKMIREYFEAMKPIVDSQNWSQRLSSDYFPDSFNKIYSFINN